MGVQEIHTVKYVTDDAEEFTTRQAAEDHDFALSIAQALPDLNEDQIAAVVTALKGKFSIAQGAVLQRNEGKQLLLDGSADIVRPSVSNQGNRNNG